MTTSLRNWLNGAGIFNAVSAASSSEGSIQVVGVDDEDDDGDSTEREDDDHAPAFPALNSAQRASSSAASIPSIVSAAPAKQERAAGLMPPPPNPGLAARTPGVGLSVPRGAPNTLMLPPSTTKAAPLGTKKREKVALAPGFGPLDWASLKSSGEDLRRTGEPGMLRITTSELKQHRKRDDCWSAFNGKVYNITSYLPYHPGGEKELLRVAGRDGTQLFMSTHAWVNADYMLDACLIGFLVSD